MRLTSFFSPLEAKRLFQLGTPIFIAQISGMGMSLVDTIMTGQASSVDMAAVAVACSIWNPISLFGLGVLLAISPLVAQAVGEKREHETPHIMRQGIWCSLLLSLPLMLIFYIVSWQMGAFDLEERLQDLSGGYLRAILWGLPAFYVFGCIRSLVEGFSITKPSMIIALLALLLNIPVNYILIYGKFGFPALGAVGCGVATAICFVFMAVAMIVYACSAKKFKYLGNLFRPLFFAESSNSPQVPQASRFDGKVIKRIFRIGVPGALAMLFEITLFAASALAIAPLGTLFVAGHQVATSVSHVLFIIPLSISITTTIRIGHYLGAGQYVHARYAAWTSLCIGLVIACISAVFVLYFKDFIVHVFNDEEPVTNLAKYLLFYAASYQIVDSIQVIGAGVLRGYNDTRIISIASFISFWIVGFPVGYILCHTDMIVPALGAAGFWWGFIIALSINAALFMLRIKKLHALNHDVVQQKIHS